MTIENDLAKIAEQERRLRFASLDYDLLWQLGGNLRALARQRGFNMAIEIRVAGNTIFHSAMPGTSPEQAEWARRKRNTVEAMHVSSYKIGLLDQLGAKTFEKSARSAQDHATHGGSFPLMIEGLGAIGAVTVSGAPQRLDHSLVVEALAAMLGVPLDEVAFDAA